MSEGIISRAALRRLQNVIGGDPADLDELLGDFLDAAPELVSQICAAAEVGDLDALRISAHTLKSNARDFGALDLSELCEELERECRDGTITASRERAEAIATAELAARQVLSELRSTDFL
ncbi:MAG: Hpt domain-containing protein [Sphingomonadales bacterium]|nr:MAG: Hpt domain-containing protein [Sphingomonadales bacterium]